MLRTRYALVALVLAVPVHEVLAQCPGCAPDLACIVSPAYPTLCPVTPPDATAGEPYAADFTFWMPTSFTDPGSGFTVDFQQMTITGISGLPFGLAFEASAPGGVYYPQENQFGCARVCGTPIGAGVYTVTISILATVMYSGITINSPQQFPIVLTVLPGSGGNLSFSYSPTSGCSPVSASFQALIDASPSPMTYAWDFGNGTTSDLAQPPAQTYEQTGTYVITLQTTVGGYLLNSVVLTGVNDNWCGDVEEPDIPFVGCTGSPDPYFVLTDAGGGTITSGSVDNSSTASWADLGILMDNGPYSISFYDEDAVSQNDLLGTYNIPSNSSGTLFVNVAGGTTGSLDISIEPLQLFADTDTIVVFPLPELVLLEDTMTGELCALNDSLVSYLWLLDGDTVPMATSPCYTPTGPGLWQVVGTNGFGCAMISDTVVVCPTFDIVRSDDVLFVPSGYPAYAWTHDGIPIGGDDAFIFTEGDGLYVVIVDAGNGCVIEEDYLLITTGSADPGNSGSRFALFPVPNEGAFTVVAEGLRGPLVYLRITDMTGRILMQRAESTSQGALRADMEVALAQGSYVLQLLDGDHARTLRLVIH
ncbi:MAG: PKD domain-containing protein [Flavobacteriales bacterium]